MELVVLSESATKNVKVCTIWDVSHQKRKKVSSSPVFAPSTSARGREPVKPVPLRPQVGNFSIDSCEAEDDAKAYKTY